MTKNHTKTLVFTTSGILQSKQLMIVKIFTVWILCIYLLIMRVGYIEEENENKYLIFDSTDENKELLKNTMVFGMESKTKSNK